MMLGACSNEKLDREKKERKEPDEQVATDPKTLKHLVHLQVKEGFFQHICAIDITFFPDLSKLILLIHIISTTFRGILQPACADARERFRRKEDKGMGGSVPGLGKLVELVKWRAWETIHKLHGDKETRSKNTYPIGIRQFYCCHVITWLVSAVVCYPVRLLGASVARETSEPTRWMSTVELNPENPRIPLRDSLPRPRQSLGSAWTC